MVYGSGQGLKIMTKDEIEAEREKCKNDILYFLDNYVQPKLELTDTQRHILSNMTAIRPDVVFKPRPWGTATMNRVADGWREFVKARADAT